MTTPQAHPRFPRPRRRGRIPTIVGIALLLVAFVGIGTATASTGDTVCTPVRLTGEGVATSPTTTTATIFLGGRAIATTAATFTNNPDGSFTGPVVFTPKRFTGGTLIAQVTGTFGPGFASFTASGPVTGTGKLSRASGNLRFVGPIRPDGTFSEVVTGRLCVDLRGW